MPPSIAVQVHAFIALLRRSQLTRCTNVPPVILAISYSVPVILNNLHIIRSVFFVPIKGRGQNILYIVLLSNLEDNIPYGFQAWKWGRPEARRLGLGM